ncbi:small nuclear RNA activating complex, polypeptide 3 [Halocaridina rubra]|uniref:snRNA-activating protein complex subunit 3 n=1 Tax=Halocaridina rubra TaxID=373956 RepID=A0AAN9AB32_HALRR
MENIYNLKQCPWITEEPINLRKYFEEYHELLDIASGKPHHEKAYPDESLLQFFPTSSDENLDETFDLENSTTCGAKLDDTEVSFAGSTVDLQKMEQDCSVDLLTVEDELATEGEYILIEPIRHSGSLTNWYAGNFEDGIIPPRGLETLQTLQEQAMELHKRENVRDYARHRQRLLKYFSTIRMITDENNHPEPTRQKHIALSSFRDIVLNVRIQRPYHKKTYLKKSSNRFPSHSQELLLLGSQNLSDLRDALICINDLGVNQDFSADPQIHHLSHVPNNSIQFPSGFFYINGVFYNDVRDLDAKLYSDNIIKWAKRHVEIGEVKAAKMHETKFIDLELRLGYPYVYMHQGNCEHIIVFTDVRLHHPTDPQDSAKYPMFRGQATKLAVKCHICSLFLANWIVMNDSRIPVPNAHVCDRCLKQFCYNNKGMKIEQNLKVYPFTDEFFSQQKKEFKYSNI